MLDAIVYILHGHVFATAMTGNTVLLCVSLLAGDTAQALRHFSPLVTFSCGILLGWAILRHLPQPGRAHRVALLFQMIALLVAGAASANFPSPPIVVLVAITASVQIATFQKLDKVTYNTTFITGNFRTLLEAAYDRIFDADKQAANAQLRMIAAVCFGFVIGALLGAFIAPQLHNHSLWLADLVLLTVFLLLNL